MLKSVLKDLNPIIKGELMRAQFHNGKTFHSPHEGYAVIKEEMEECSEALVKTWNVFNDVWEAIRDDREVPGDKMWDMKRCAEETAAEAVQVVAMCHKFMISKYEWEADDE